MRECLQRSSARAGRQRCSVNKHQVSLVHRFAGWVTSEAGSEPGFPKVSPKWPLWCPLFPPVLLCAAAKQPPVHHKRALVRFLRPGRKPLVNALPAHFIKAGIKSWAQLKWYGTNSVVTKFCCTWNKGDEEVTDRKKKKRRHFRN